MCRDCNKCELIELAETLFHNTFKLERGIWKSLLEVVHSCLNLSQPKMESGGVRGHSLARLDIELEEAIWATGHHVSEEHKQITNQKQKKRIYQTGN